MKITSKICYFTFMIFGYLYLFLLLTRYTAEISFEKVECEYGFKSYAVGDLNVRSDEDWCQLCICKNTREFECVNHTNCKYLNCARTAFSYEKECCRNMGCIVENTKPSLLSLLFSFKLLGYPLKGYSVGSPNRGERSVFENPLFGNTNPSRGLLSVNSRHNPPGQPNVFVSSKPSGSYIGDALNSSHGRNYNIGERLPPGGGPINKSNKVNPYSMRRPPPVGMPGRPKTSSQGSPKTSLSESTKTLPGDIRKTKHLNSLETTSQASKLTIDLATPISIDATKTTTGSLVAVLVIIIILIVIIMIIIIIKKSKRTPFNIKNFRGRTFPSYQYMSAS